MNEYEISKLKKEIQRKNDHLKEAQEENKYISDQLVKAQAVLMPPFRKKKGSMSNFKSHARPSRTWTWS